MKITHLEFWTEHFELTRPYTIAFKTTDTVDNPMVKVETDAGVTGMGAASPEHFVTGETVAHCEAALASLSTDWLIGQDVGAIPALLKKLSGHLPDAPAARAALDMALHDLYARSLERPLVDVLGRCHDALPTSITIGIKSVEATVSEAQEYLDRGFRVLKVKGGHELDVDVARLKALRETFGPDITIRVDPNQGYSVEEVSAFMAMTGPLGIEFLEQPVKTGDFPGMQGLPEAIRDRIAADESLITPADAITLAGRPRTCGIFNIKLMKCGGITQAGRIAAIAQAAGIDLMWGCMDESIISISAALHAALAAPATRYLDLDGSLDLARDIVSGGFRLENGCLSTLDAPGLGITPLS